MRLCHYNETQRKSQIVSHAKLIELTLPFCLQALRAPVKWKAEQLAYKNGDVETLLTPILVSDQTSTSYDSWEMRNEFLDLKEGDNEGLVSLLNKVGYWS